MNKLMLLAGGIKREGWKTLDCNPDCRADIVATIPPLPEEVTSCKWDEVECIHGVNVIYPWETEAILSELFKVMAPDGLLVLEQPDIDKAIRRYMDDRTLLRMVFGDPSTRDVPGMVRWGYTPDSLKDLVGRCGFTRV